MADSTFTKLESERIVLRRFRDSDTEPFLAYRADPDVARYQSWEDYTRDEAKRFVAAMRSLHPDIPGEWFQFAIEIKATNAMIGDCGLLTLQEEPRQAEIGVTVATEHQGKGYAMEAVTCLMDYVFTSLRKHRVRAITDCKNTRTIALLERIGMRREGTLFKMSGSRARGATNIDMLSCAENGFLPRERRERSYNVRRRTEMPRGGHFAALEKPELLAVDIRVFFGPLRAS